MPVVKFLAPVAPGASLVIAFRLAAKALEWQIHEASAPVAAGQFARADIGAAP